MGSWSDATVWWLLAGILVAVEMATCTFYLLMLSLGAVVAALAAHLGLQPVMQILVGTLVGGGAVIGWHMKRRRDPQPVAAAFNPDVNLDIGSRVHVPHWATDGTARVQYRGAGWQARYVGNGVPIAGDYVVRAIEANALLLDR